MDGLTISNSNALLDRGQTLKEIRDSKLQVPQPNISGGAEGPKSVRLGLRVLFFRFALRLAPSFVSGCHVIGGRSLLSSRAGCIASAG